MFTGRGYIYIYIYIYIYREYIRNIYIYIYGGMAFDRVYHRGPGPKVLMRRLWVALGGLGEGL